MQHEAADAGAGVEDGENKQRLKHDGEVIPEADELVAHAGALQDATENLGHAEGEGRCATGASEESFFAGAVGELGHGVDGDREVPRTDFGHSRGGSGPTMPAGELTAK